MVQRQAYDSRDVMLYWWKIIWPLPLFALHTGLGTECRSADLLSIITETRNPPKSHLCNLSSILWPSAMTLRSLESCSSSLMFFFFQLRTLRGIRDFLLPHPILSAFSITLNNATRNYPPPSSTRRKGCSFQEAALSLERAQENPTDTSPSRVHAQPYCSQLQPYGHHGFLLLLAPMWVPHTKE